MWAFRLGLGKAKRKSRGRCERTINIIGQRVGLGVTTRDRWWCGWLFNRLSSLLKSGRGVEEGGGLINVWETESANSQLVALNRC